jgi:hypothetical protein
MLPVVQICDGYGSGRGSVGSYGFRNEIIRLQKCES